MGPGKSGGLLKTIGDASRRSTSRDVVAMIASREGKQRNGCIDASSEGERVLWGKRTRSRSREIPSSKRGEVSCKSHEGAGQQGGFRAHSSIGLEVPRISAVIRDSGGRTRRGPLPPSAQGQGTRVRARNSRRGPGKPGSWSGRSNASRRPRLRRSDHRESSR